MSFSDPDIFGVDCQAALLKDRQEWILREPYSRSDLVVTGYNESMSGLFCLPAQGWDRRVAQDAERQLRDFVLAPALQGRHSSRRQPTPDAEVVAES